MNIDKLDLIITVKNQIIKFKIYIRDIFKNLVAEVNRIKINYENNFCYAYEQILV